MGVMGLALTALLLYLFLYPFRIKVQYGEEDGKPPLQLGIHLLGPLNVTLRIPVWRHAPGTPDHPPGPDATQGPEGSSAGQPAPQGSGTPTDQAEDHLTRLVMVSRFIQGLFFEVGEGESGRAEGPLKRLVGAKFFLLYFVRKCERLDWETRIGTSEAASTALIVGTLWGIKSYAYTVLAREVHFLNPPRFAIHPNWEEAAFKIRILGIFRFRVGEIILAWIGYSVRKWKGVHRLGHGERASY